MPRRIVRQPNGLLAVFSTAVDDFIAYDMTEESALEYLLGICGHESTARSKLAAGLEDHPEPWAAGARRDGLYRWRGALDAILHRHGPEVRADREREIGRVSTPEPREAGA